MENNKNNNKNIFRTFQLKDGTYFKNTKLKQKFTGSYKKKVYEGLNKQWMSEPTDRKRYNYFIKI